MSTIKVQNIQHTGSSTNAIALASDGTCTANITNNLSNRNLIINGAMQVAQRGSSSTIDGYGSIDRFRSNLAGCDENPTQSQSDVASGTTPYTLGFRKAFKFTNGNQTSGAGTTDCVAILHRIEAQDIANSGWNYTDTNSKITLSFWCKSSVAQNFYGFFRTQDGTSQLNAFETGSLTADTWTKVTKTITGGSNLQFDSNNDTGLDIEFTMFRGTDRTGSLTLNQWAAYDTNVRVPDMTSTWFTTNDSTFEITGVQLEVGDHATDFEHRSFHDELYRCYRYFQRFATGDGKSIGLGYYYSSSHLTVLCDLFTTMRATPTLSMISGTHYYVVYRDGAADTFNSFTIDTGASDKRVDIYNSSEISGTAGQTGVVRCNNAAPNGGQIDFNAEL